MKNDAVALGIGSEALVEITTAPPANVEILDPANEVKQRALADTRMALKSGGFCPISGVISGALNALPANAKSALKTRNRPCLQAFSPFTP